MSTILICMPIWWGIALMRIKPLMPLSKQSGNFDSLSVEINSSKGLSIFILSGLCFAILSIVICQIIWQIKFFLIVLALIYSSKMLSQYAFCVLDESIVHCQRLDGILWRLTTRRGNSFLAKQCVYSYRSSTLIVLYFKVTQLEIRERTVKVPIAFDSTSTLTFIRLLSQLWISSR